MIKGVGTNLKKNFILAYLFYR